MKNNKSNNNNYNVKIDQDTFDALICDCYRRVHSPFTKHELEDGTWIQVPYHYQDDYWDYNQDLKKILDKV